MKKLLLITITALIISNVYSQPFRYQFAYTKFDSGLIVNNTFYREFIDTISFTNTNITRLAINEVGFNIFAFNTTTRQVSNLSTQYLVIDDLLSLNLARYQNPITSGLYYLTAAYYLPLFYATPTLVLYYINNDTKLIIRWRHGNFTAVTSGTARYYRYCVIKGVYQ